MQPTQKNREGPESISLPAGLYLVATPIGNMRDITFRALDVLAAVDFVAAEDTRVTGKLLNAFGLKKKMLSYNDHSSVRQRDVLMGHIRDGKSVALVSDAGTPLVSDPGYKLVRGAVEQNIKVTSIPGASAAVTALQLSGLPSDAFSFAGFLPSKTSARKKMLKKWADVPGTLIFYETGPRLTGSLKDMKEVLGDRSACIARELTKMFEEIRRGSLSGLIAESLKKEPPKGEIVVVVGQGAAPETSSERLEDQITKALETMSVRDAAEAVSIASGKPKKAIYTLALKLSGKK